MRVAFTSLGWTILCNALWAIEPSEQGVKARNWQRDMIAALEAAAPHPSLGEQARVLGQFIGTWECDYANFAEDGTQLWAEHHLKRESAAAPARNKP